MNQKKYRDVFLSAVENVSQMSWEYVFGVSD